MHRRCPVFCLYVWPQRSAGLEAGAKRVSQGTDPVPFSGGRFWPRFDFCQAARRGQGEDRHTTPAEVRRGCSRLAKTTRTTWEGDVAFGRIVPRSDCPCQACSGCPRIYSSGERGFGNLSPVCYVVGTHSQPKIKHAREGLVTGGPRRGEILLWSGTSHPIRLRMFSCCRLHGSSQRGDRPFGPRFEAVHSFAPGHDQPAIDSVLSPGRYRGHARGRTLSRRTTFREGPFEPFLAPRFVRFTTNNDIPCATSIPPFRTPRFQSGIPPTDQIGTVAFPPHEGLRFLRGDVRDVLRFKEESTVGAFNFAHRATQQLFGLHFSKSGRFVP